MSAWQILPVEAGYYISAPARKDGSAIVGSCNAYIVHYSARQIANIKPDLARKYFGPIPE